MPGHASYPDSPLFCRRRADLLEQLLVETATDLNIVKRHMGLPPLRIDHRPLPQSQRLIGENQRQSAVARAVGARQRSSASAPAGAGSRSRVTGPEAPPYRPAECPAASGSSPILLVCCSAELLNVSTPCAAISRNGAGGSYWNRIRPGRCSHAVPSDTPPSSRHLEEMRLQRFQAVQVGLDRAQCPPDPGQTHDPPGAARAPRLNGKARSGQKTACDDRP